MRVRRQHTARIDVDHQELDMLEAAVATALIDWQGQSAPPVDFVRDGERFLALVAEVKGS